MKILDVKIDNLNKREILEKVNGFLKSSDQHYLTTPNPEFLVKAQKDEDFKRILNSADICVPDGVGLTYASIFLREPIKERIQGVDLMDKICKQAAQKEWSVFLMGAEMGISDKAAEKLKEKYPDLKISSGHEEVSGQPEILFVALGAPKQEKWIRNNLSKLPSVRLAMGVGGSFDFISGKVKRAPKSVRKIGLEWLWRLICQPWRVKRMYNAVIKFPYLVIRSKI